MNLVWHIVRKDVRQTWMYAAAVIGLLAISGWNLSRILAADRGSIGMQMPIDTVLSIAFGLFCGALVLTEAIPGTRQYWLVRPVRWGNLLAAKALVLGMLAVAPLTIVHIGLVSWRGLPVWGSVGNIAWNALLLVLVCVLPVAVLASISRNLQTLILSLLAVGVVAIALHQFIRVPTEELRGVVNSSALLAGAPVGMAILAWQYSTRRTGAGRVAVMALCAFLLSLDFWPVSVWYAVQRFSSPQPVGAGMATLRLNTDSISWWPQVAGSTWRGRGQLDAPYLVEGLPDGWSFEVNSWRVARVSNGAPSDLSVQNTGSVRLWSSSRFLEDNLTKPLDIDLVAEGTIYGPVERHSMPVNGERNIPNVGRCRADARDTLLIDCQSILRPQVKFGGYWGTAQVLSQREDRSVLPMPSPVSVIFGGLGARSSFESNDIVFEVRKPMAYVQRTLELRGIRLSEIER